MTGKGFPMTHRGTEIKGAKNMTDVDLAITYSDNSPAKKTKLLSTKSSAAEVTSGFETAWTDAVEEINGLFSKFSEVLQERAAIDAAQVEQLEGVLSEALCLESQLKEKKEHLRRSLAIISDKLQG